MSRQDKSKEGLASVVNELTVAVKELHPVRTVSIVTIAIVVICLMAGILVAFA